MGKKKPCKPKPKANSTLVDLALANFREAEREFHRQTVFVGGARKPNPAQVLTSVIIK